MAEDSAVYREIYRRFAAGELTTDAAARAIMAVMEAEDGAFSLVLDSADDIERQRGRDLFQALQLLAIERATEGGVS